MSDSEETDDDHYRWEQRRDPDAGGDAWNSRTKAWKDRREKSQRWLTASLVCFACTCVFMLGLYSSLLFFWTGHARDGVVCIVVDALYISCVIHALDNCIKHQTR
jgi:hypothetical protein